MLEDRRQGIIPIRNHIFQISEAHPIPIGIPTGIQKLIQFVIEALFNDYDKTFDRIQEAGQYSHPQ